MSATRARELVGLIDDVGHELRAGRGIEVARAPWSTSTFVRTDVIGVRSSCEASATSRRWAATDAVSSACDACRRSSIVVEARGEHADLVVPTSRCAG